MCLSGSCCFQADLSYNVQEDPTAFYGVTSQYESSENMTITCSTKVCSFGKQVVEKVEVRRDESYAGCIMTTATRTVWSGGGKPRTLHNHP